MPSFHDRIGDGSAGQSTAQPLDLLIIGGGINGAGIARDAAGRGLRVLLCEQGDLASHTSSTSTKLIHGGLRYLEHYEFRLVREALRERDRLMGIAPHIIRPLHFVLPHNRNLRPPWMIRAGLFLYDHLGGRTRLPGSRGIDLRRHPAGKVLDPQTTRGFVYSDCRTQDARLVVLNAMDAAARGATILTHTACTGARREMGLWRITLDDGRRQWSVRARALVNAAGPWASELFDHVISAPSSPALRLVKGSHIVVPKLFEHDFAYILQLNDRRIVFAIPYEGAYTLIGTTDINFSGDPATAHIDRDEIHYLCDAVNGYFMRRISPEDVIWSYSGVRPLFGDSQGSASEITRDYVLDLDVEPGQAPLLSVLGGKLTTYRRLAEQALERLAAPLGASAPVWTDRSALPGGDLPEGGLDAFTHALTQRHPWLPAAQARRYAGTYGTRAEAVVASAHEISDLGEHFGADLYEAEVRYLVDHEWAQRAEDILWRRTKLGLHLSAAQQAYLETWLERENRAALDIGEALRNC